MKSGAVAKLAWQERGAGKAAGALAAIWIARVKGAAMDLPQQRCAMRLVVFIYELEKLPACSMVKALGFVNHSIRVAALTSCLLVLRLHADWKDEIGLTRLQALAGNSLPTAPSAGLTQVEAQEGSNYAPNSTSTLFSGKTLMLKSGTSGTSSHADHVARNFYASTSQVPGSCQIDLYNANDWLSTGYLNFGVSSAPKTESRAVQNHSWAGSSGNSSYDTEISRRLDFAINRDGFVCAVGLYNQDANTPVHALLLCQTYNTISVGRDDGGHTKGLTTLDGNGRRKPDIVAPSAAPEYATSWTTPMVSGAAALLYQKLVSDYSPSVSDRPRVIKALLLASATKNTVPDWGNSSSSPLDDVYGAGELNIHHAYHALIAGKATAGSTRYGIRGWASDTVSSSSSKTYYFRIASGAPSTPFSAALTWHRAVNNLVWNSSLANLRLKLYQTDGTNLTTLLATSDSSVDNVELIHQPSLAPGDYALRVESSSSSTAYALAWHSLPAVTIATTVSTAHEIDGAQGAFRLTRTGDLGLPLQVPLTTTGTAIAGTHYLALPATVTIPAGQSAISLQLSPVSDSLAQGDRSVGVKVGSDFAIVSDSSQAATITIKDKPFDAWRFGIFSTTELSNPRVSGELADPDGDELVNLIEYAFGLNPKLPNLRSVLFDTSGGYLVVSTAKNPTAADIAWSAQVSSDLKNWTPAQTTIDNSTNFEARDTDPVKDSAKRFIRIIIVKP